jgi:hypothetical protein
VAVSDQVTLKLSLPQISASCSGFQQGQMSGSAKEMNNNKKGCHYKPSQFDKQGIEPYYKKMI